MDTKKINLDGLKNVLSPKEMKNVTGGSGSYTCWCGSNTFAVNADSCSDAKDAVNTICGGGCSCYD